jgi:hypothetical protein
MMQHRQGVAGALVPDATVVRATIAQDIELLQPRTQHSGVVNAETLSNAVLVAPLEHFVVLGNSSKVPRFDGNPDWHGLVRLPMPHDAIFPATIYLLVLTGRPLDPRIALPTRSVGVVASLGRIDDITFLVSQWIVITHFVRNHAANVHLNAFNGIQHQLTQLLVEQVQRHDLVELGARQKRIAAAWCLGRIRTQSNFAGLGVKLAADIPEATQPVVTHLGELAFRTLCVVDLHATRS